MLHTFASLTKIKLGFDFKAVVSTMQAEAKNNYGTCICNVVVTLSHPWLYSIAIGDGLMKLTMVIFP